MSESDIFPQKKNSKAIQNTIKVVLQVRALFSVSIFLKKENTSYFMIHSVCFE